MRVCVFNNKVILCSQAYMIVCVCVCLCVLTCNTCMALDKNTNAGHVFLYHRDDIRCEGAV